MEQKALCESALHQLVCWKSYTITSSRQCCTGLGKFPRASQHALLPIRRVTSSRPCRLRHIWLSGAGKQACQVRNKCHRWNVHIWAHYGRVSFFSARAWNRDIPEANLTENMGVDFRQITIKHVGLFDCFLLHLKNSRSAPLFIRLAWVWPNVHAVEQILWQFPYGGIGKQDAGTCKNPAFVVLPDWKNPLSPVLSLLLSMRKM